MKTIEPSTVNITANQGTVTSHIFNGGASEEDIATCNRLFKEKKYQACYDFSKQLLVKAPNSRVARLSLGRSAAELKQYDLALAILLSEHQKSPESSNICDALASVYALLNQDDIALNYAKQAVTYNVGDGGAHNNLALYAFEQGLFDDALYHYQQAIKLNNLPSAHLGLSLTLLAMRRYQEGWAAYESRMLLPGTNIRPIKLDIPFWDKTEPLTGKSLMITWEQGIGDNIQFMRFIPLLKQRYNPKIFISCGSSIGKLCKTIPDVEQVFSGRYLIFPNMDYQINMLSLPYMLDIHDESQFLTNPYIEADPALIAKWHPYLGENKKFRVGICWRGRSYYSNTAKRDCPLDYFLQLPAYHNLSLISLQRDLTESETEILHYSGIYNLGDTVDDIVDTVAVIASLDLVITVDTAIAHLAGAMGKPVWTLIRYETEWRHPRDCDISPWYPSMRLIRQTRPGDWDSVFAQVANALATLYPMDDHAYEAR